MERDFRQGHLTIDFPVAPFDAALPLLRDTVRVFFANFQLLATATLAVYLPGKLATQLLCHLAGIPFEGVTSYLILTASDLLLSCFVVPAIVYGLVERLRNSRKAPLGECFRWGRRQYGRTLANQLAVEITVTLWGALLVIPGVMAMVRLVFTDVVVAVEGDLQSTPLERSRQLSLGRRWRIFGVMLPMLLLGMLATFVLLDRIQAATQSRATFAVADSLLAVAAQSVTVSTLLMYLGTTQKRVTKLKP
jgi:hypothetical protein